MINRVDVTLLNDLSQSRFYLIQIIIYIQQTIYRFYMSVEKCQHACNHYANQLMIIVVILLYSASQFLYHIPMHCFTTVLGEYDSCIHRGHS